VPSRARVGAALSALCRHPYRFAKAAARLPVELDAAALLAALPTVDLAELTGPGEVTVAVSSDRGEWSLGATEQMVLASVVKARRITSVFEIGTFNGGTTKLLADSMPEGGHVWTLDLPAAQFDGAQSVRGFRGRQVGEAFKGTSAEERIEQLLGDSLTMDFSPYHCSAQLVLVDGGHEYENGVADTRAALEIVKPGGVVLWDDFQPYWDGLVRGILDAMHGRPIARLSGTALGVYVAPH